MTTPILKPHAYRDWDNFNEMVPNPRFDDEDFLATIYFTSDDATYPYDWEIEDQYGENYTAQFKSEDDYIQSIIEDEVTTRNNNVAAED